MIAITLLKVKLADSMMFSKREISQLFLSRSLMLENALALAIFDPG